jgi:hypothetical protein
MDRITLQVVEAVSDYCGHPINAVFGSAQPCLSSYMGAHADDSFAYCHDWIGDLSLVPATRVMRVVHRSEPYKIDIPLPPLSLVTFRGKTVQQKFLHSILAGRKKDIKSGDPEHRLALVFRNMRYIEPVYTIEPIVNKSLVKEGTWEETAPWLTKYLFEQKQQRKLKRTERQHHKFFGLSKTVKIGALFRDWTELLASRVHNTKSGM